MTEKEIKKIKLGAKVYLSNGTCWRLAKLQENGDMFLVSKEAQLGYDGRPWKEDWGKCAKGEKGKCSCINNDCAIKSAGVVEVGDHWRYIHPSQYGQVVSVNKPPKPISPKSPKSYETRWKTMQGGMTSRGIVQWQPKKWQSIYEQPVLCSKGFHCCKYNFECLSHTYEPVLAIVQVAGRHAKDESKQAWEQMRVMKAWDLQTQLPTSNKIFEATRRQVARIVGKSLNCEASLGENKTLKETLRNFNILLDNTPAKKQTLVKEYLHKRTEQLLENRAKILC